MVQRPGDVMVRFAVLALVVAACNADHPLAEAAPAPAPAPQASPAPKPSALPDGFPARGAPTVTGTLAGKPFTAKKMMLRTGDGASLSLYGWVEGGACEPQFAPDKRQLYVEVMVPAPGLVVGAPITNDAPGVVAIYQKPSFDPVKTSVAVVLDGITDTHATGRLVLTGPDNTRVTGSFDATVCASKQQAAAQPTTANELAWGRQDVAPDALPTKPVAAVLLGKPVTPAAVEVIDWDDGTYSQHELHFFATKPAKPCQFDLMAPGFKIGFHGAIAIGNTIQARSSTVSHTGDPFGVVAWEEPGHVLGIEGGGWISARIDAVSRTEVRGRIYAWFDDKSQSMLAGAFVARNCHVHP